LVVDLGLNLAGVELALELFNQLLGMKAGLNAMKGENLRHFLEKRLEESFELLQTRLP